MKDELISILEEFGYPVYLQGSLAADEAYPASFFTFWNNETTDGNHYDGDPARIIWDFTVYFYSNDTEAVNTTLVQLRKKLRENAWITDGIGYDVPSDEKTHTGRAIDCWYMQKITEEREGE